MLMGIAKAVGGILALVVLISCVQQARNSGDAPLPERAGEVLRVATYNAHYIVLLRETGAWSKGDWERRKGPMDEAFKAMDADIVGFQEMESFGGRSVSRVNLAKDWLLERNPGFAAAAVGDPEEFPSTQPIFYRKDRLEMLDQGWFFFSDTPDVIYAKTFNGSYPAFASWAQFRDLATGRDFRVVNIHTDYASASNRLKSAALVAERMAPWRDAGETVFVIGDLNSRAGDATYGVLADAGVDFAPIEGSTFHFNRGVNLFGAIDHIGHLGAAERVGEPMVIRRKFSGEWPTDHYPVIVDYRL